MRRSHAGRVLGLIGVLLLALTLAGNAPLAVTAMAAGTAWREPVSPKMRTLPSLTTTTNRAGRQAAAPLAPATTCNPAWNAVNSPSAGNASDLIAISAAAANDIWSVGVLVNGSNVLQTLAEHWNGQAWTVVPTPNQGAGDNVLGSVTAISGSDVWAVGYWRPDNSSPRQSLTEHWNGNAWINVGAPQVPNASNSLFGVGADASNDVWAVGRDLNVPEDPVLGPSGQTITMHWNGSAWSMASPINANSNTSELNAVKVLGPNDAWAVGDGQNFTGPQFPFPPTVLIEHWNGATWTRVAAAPDNPNGNFLSDVNGAGSDLWAVGGQSKSSTTDSVLTEHWNGTSWSAVPGATPDLSTNLFGLAYVASNNVYAVGASAYQLSSTTTTELDHTLIEQWNGTTWSQVMSANPSPNNDLFGATAISAGDVWAAGFMAVNGVPQTLTENLCTPPAITGIAPTSGPGGTQVVITGMGFTGAVVVDFGNSAAAFHVDSDTQITASSPGHSAGTVDVTVTVQGTSSTSAADQFTYVGRSVAPSSPVVQFRNRAPVPPKFQAAPSQAQPFARPRLVPSSASVSSSSSIPSSASTSSLVRAEWSTQRLLVNIAIASVYLIVF